jgi:hypothetical protein
MRSTGLRGAASRGSTVMKRHDADTVIAILSLKKGAAGIYGAYHWVTVLNPPQSPFVSKGESCECGCSASAAILRQAGVA